MSRLFDALSGSAELELRSAEPEACLNLLGEYEIPFRDAAPVDAFTLRFTVPARAVKEVLSMSGELNAELRVLRERKGIRGAGALLRRPIPTAALVLAVLIGFFFPRRVWFVTVYGNETVPTDAIVRAAAECGVGFGTRNADIDAGSFKNQLLGRLDSLKWAAVNPNGAICEILVREKEPAREVSDRRVPCDITAARSGTLSSVSVLEGTQLCAVGDTVEEGQTLVSGVSVFPVRVLRVRAQAEIYAQTWYRCRVLTPRNCSVCGNRTEKSVSRYIQIGNFRVKLNGDPDGYGICRRKTRRQYPLTLPGGLKLPVSLIVETCEVYDPVPYALPSEAGSAMLETFARSTVERSMTAGRILSAETEFTEHSGVLELEADFSCSEMIARQQPAEPTGWEDENGTDTERGSDRTAHGGIRFV